MTIKNYAIYNEFEILPLYASVGWTAYTSDPESLKAGFEHSLLTLAAYEDEKLVGILRAVGDGYTIVFIQDILVFPEYQRKGIGRALIQELLSRFSQVRQIQLSTDTQERNLAFYRAMGFRELSRVGCVGFMK